MKLTLVLHPVNESISREVLTYVGVTKLSGHSKLFNRRHLVFPFADRDGARIARLLARLELGDHLLADLFHDARTFAERRLRVLATHAELLIAVGVRVAGLFDHAVLDARIDEVAGKRDPLV